MLGSGSGISLERVVKLVDIIVHDLLGSLHSRPYCAELEKKTVERV